MASSVTNSLVIGAALLGGLLAGMATNKILVEMPAWKEVGAIPWANFTRTEDQGLGLILFPVIGGAALLLTIAAAVAVYLDRTAPRSGGVPAYAAAGMAITAFWSLKAVLARESRTGFPK